MANGYQRPSAPWVNALTPLTQEDSDDNKWNLLYGLSFISASGYTGLNLEQSLNYISSQVPDLLNMVSTMVSDPVFKAAPLLTAFNNDGENGTPETQSYSASSSSTEITRAALIHRTLTSMVREYFKGNDSTSNSLIESFLQDRIHTSHVGCSTLGALYNALSRILNVLSWFWRSPRCLSEAERNNLLQFSANTCLTKFYDHCSSNTGFLKMSARSHMSGNTDNMSQWVALKKALSEMQAEKFPLSSRSSLIFTPSPAATMHVNPVSQLQGIPPPPEVPPPSSAALSPEVQKQIQEQVLSLFSSQTATSSQGSSVSTRAHSRQRDRSPSPRRSRDRDRDRDSSRDYRRRSPPRSRNTYRSKSKEQCRDYGRGRCTYGNSCRFEHSISRQSNTTPASEKRCFQYDRNGTCRFGSNCNYSHSSQPRESNSSNKTALNTNKQIQALTAHVNTLVSSATEQKKQLASLSAYAAAQKAVADKAARDAEIRQQAYAFYQQHAQAFASQPTQRSVVSQPTALSISGQSALPALTDQSPNIPLLNYIPKN